MGRKGGCRRALGASRITSCKRCAPRKQSKLPRKLRAGIGSDRLRIPPIGLLPQWCKTLAGRAATHKAPQLEERLLLHDYRRTAAAAGCRYVERGRVVLEHLFGRVEADSCTPRFITGIKAVLERRERAGGSFRARAQSERVLMEKRLRSTRAPVRPRPSARSSFAAESMRWRRSPCTW